jgi:hypothetical protein
MRGELKLVVGQARPKGLARNLLEIAAQTPDAFS